MKNFKVQIINSETYGIKETVTVQAHNKSDAAFTARQKHGAFMQGKYFPLHWSEIGVIKLPND